MIQSRNDAAPGDYVTRAFDAFDRAAQHAGLQTRDIVVAGMAVRLHFAGEAMLPVVYPAISHLEREVPEGVRFDLHVWDSASTGVPMPPPRWPLEAFRTRGEIEGFVAHGIRAAFSVDGPQIDLWETSTSRGMIWASDSATVPYYERAAPARRILSWWLAQHGRLVLHGGAVGAPAGCVLLAGKGGSGKSTTALACLTAGCTYLADDYCVLESGDAPAAHSLYATAKVHGADLDRLGFRIGDVSNAGRLAQEKALFFLADRFRPQLRSGARLKALVLPRVTPGAVTRLTVASAAEATHTIAMSTIAQLPYAGREVLQRVATIARQLPAFHLDLGRDGVERAPELVRSLASGEVIATCG